MAEMKEVQDRYMMLTRVPPILIQTVRNSTLLINDVVGIIGQYWVTIHSEYHGRTVQYEENDVSDFLDRPNPQDEIPVWVRQGACFLENVFLSGKHPNKDIESHLSRMYCVLGKTKQDLFILRLLTGLPPNLDDIATWRSSLSLQTLLQHMPLSQYQELIKKQHQSQEIELQNRKVIPST